MRNVELGNFALFNEIRDKSQNKDIEINNHKALNVSSETRGVHIAWMFPDVLNMHGGRGDAMALLHFSNLMKLPCTIRRINRLHDEIPFEWADMIFFPSGDLSSMADVCKVLTAQKDKFINFAEKGKVILATGSTGAVLAEKTVFLDGHSFSGLGLLGMGMKQREKVHGDDLWIEVSEGKELLGTQIQLADVILRDEQKPLGKTIYGRGNSGKGQEGARKNNVIFTHLLGPVLAKNPWFTEELLKTAASSAGISVDNYKLDLEDVLLEQSALEDHRTFVQKKMNGEIS